MTTKPTISQEKIEKELYNEFMLVVITNQKNSKMTGKEAEPHIKGLIKRTYLKARQSRDDEVRKLLQGKFKTKVYCLDCGSQLCQNANHTFDKRITISKKDYESILKELKLND